MSKKNYLLKILTMWLSCVFGSRYNREPAPGVHAVEK